MKTFLSLSFIIGMATASTLAFAQAGYTTLPNADERQKIHSGYFEFPGFDRIHLVKEGEGTLEPAAKLIRDPELKSLLQNGQFKSLQVRNLGIKRSEIVRSTSLSTGEQQIQFPFIVSVKHTQNSGSNLNIDQGTIEVAGEITVQWDGKSLKVQVTHFDDSQLIERFGRKMLNANSNIDLEFARKVVVPVLEGYFATQPGALDLLLTFAPPQAQPNRRP